MKINKDFIIRKIAGDIIVVPIGRMARECSGLIAINEVSEFIWKMLENEATEDEIVASIMTEFQGTTEDVVRQDVKEFIQLLIKHKVLEE